MKEIDAQLGRVADMYAMYRIGNSLSDIAKQFGISRQRVHQLFKEYRLKLRDREHGIKLRSRINILVRDKNMRETGMKLRKCEFCQHRQFCRRIRVNAKWVWACLHCWRH